MAIIGNLPVYGIVNKAIEELVLSLSGPEGWNKVCALAEIDPFTFVTLERYDDTLTFKLVGACAEVLGISADEVLVSFGRYWSRYTGRQGYAHMFSMLGNDLFSFLQNLPSLHDHLTLVFPDMVMPRFETVALDERRLHVAYRSERSGLAAMVHGLLEGMAEVYGQPVTVTRLQRKDEGADHDLFEVVLQ